MFSPTIQPQTDLMSNSYLEILKFVFLGEQGWEGDERKIWIPSGAPDYFGSSSYASALFGAEQNFFILQQVEGLQLQLIIWKSQGNLHI